MPRKRFFHTGEFAKIVGVNKRTLHYYDAEGIFRPAHVEPNGYRSYSFRQFYPFFLIRQFRAMGLDLAEIKEYMEHRSPARLDALLAAQQEWLRGELARVKRQMQSVRNQRALLAQARTVVCDTVARQHLPEAHLILSRNTRELAAKGDENGLESAAMEHVRYVIDQQASVGYAIGAMIALEDFLTPGSEERESYYFTITDRPIRQIAPARAHLRPAGDYLVTYFRGDYYDTAPSYARLRAYLAAHHLTPGPFSYEESIIEEMSSRDVRDYLTRIVIPICA